MSEPRPPFAETADIDTAGEDYATRFSGPVGAWFLEVQQRITLELASPWAGGRVLEVGGGHAQLAPAMAAAGFEVTVTGSHDSCRRRLDAAMAPGTFEYRTCDSLALPWPDNSFAVVMAFRLLPHVERWPELLGEMCRVASGAVILDYPDLRSFNFFSERLFGAKMAIEKNTRTFQCFWRKQLVGELAAHNFGRAKLKPQFFWPMALHRAVGSAGFSRAAEGTARALGLNALFGSPVILRAENLAVSQGGQG